MKVAQRAMALKPSATLAISSRAKELAAAGKDVLDFGVGEPGYIRFSYATSMAAIEKAIARMRAWLTK